MRADFVLGINYPWIACGHDFGPRPPPWAGAKRTDWAALARDLCALRSLGITVVRFWILADGVNYPVGRAPLEIAARVPFREYEKREGLFRLEGTPPELPPAFIEDFVALLDACRTARMQLIPSLTSFELFFPLEEKKGGVLAQGRAALVTGKNEDTFLDRALEPLLEAAKDHRDVIYAFEVMNEPDWIVLGVDGEGPWWPAPLVSSLLVNGVKRIARRGFVSTIGFSRARPTWLDRSAWDTLIELGARGAYIHQAHFYAKVGRRSRLPPALIELPCLLGEMPTARGERWADPELRETEAEDRYLEARIALARARGYRGALLWSRRATDEQTRWDASTIAQVARASDPR